MGRDGRDSQGLYKGGKGSKGRDLLDLFIGILETQEVNNIWGGLGLGDQNIFKRNTSRGQKISLTNLQGKSKSEENRSKL